MRTLVLVAALGGVAAAQPAPAAAPAKLTIGLYAPSVEFGAASARLAYVQGLAKAVEAATGIKTEAQSYANVGALKKDNVDFAIIDGPCYATNLGWHLLADAVIGGATTRPYALFSSVGTDMQQLRGKKIAYIQSGCNDAGFIDNAMLESEVDSAFFAARVGKSDLTGAVAEVASYKGAQAVFAPVASAKGLTKVFDTGAVPNPAFVELGNKLPAAIVEKTTAAVTGYGGGGAIASWSGANKSPYQALASRLGKLTKAAMFASPDSGAPVRLDAKDVLIDPPTLKDFALPEMRHYLLHPGDRME
jgi:hypothetical protein